MYYFLLPSSKIRDATFLFNEEGKNIIVIMSSAGYMYTQVMDESSSAQHGPFYVTSVLEINHEDLKVTFWKVPPPSENLRQQKPVHICLYQVNLEDNLDAFHAKRPMMYPT